jgi:cysteine desulfurase/selenocysteine lyase
MSLIEEGDEIVICISEHHSNIVPWQQVAKHKKATLKYLYINPSFTLDMDEVYSKITDKTN